MHSVIEYSWFFILLHIAQSLESKYWDPDCIDKWPGCRLGRLSYLNTVCERESCDPRFKECSEIPSDPEFRQMVLDRHNELRNKIASGKETRSNIVSAANMMALSYDLTLEFTSICHVHGCVMDHDNCRGTKKFPRAGQNLAKRHGKGKKPIKQKQLDKIVSLEGFQSLVVGWYETEIDKDDFKDLINNFTRFNHETGHFTALMWAKTTHLGCARALDRPSTYEFTMHITCNYSPQGNVMRRPIYTKGPPCSQCPSDTSCNTKYTSLCGQVDETEVHAGPNPYRQADIARGKTTTEPIDTTRKQVQHNNSNNIIPDNIFLILMFSLRFSNESFVKVFSYQRRN